MALLLKDFKTRITSPGGYVPKNLRIQNLYRCMMNKNYHGEISLQMFKESASEMVEKNMQTRNFPLNEFKQAGDAFEVTINVENQQFVVNKQVLCSNSDYFNAMLSENFSESTLKCIHLKQVDAQSFAFLIRFISGHEVCLGQEQIMSVLQAADMLCFDSFLNHFKTYLDSNWTACKVQPAFLLQYLEILRHEHPLWDVISFYYGLEDVPHKEALHVTRTFLKLLAGRRMDCFPYLKKWQQVTQVGINAVEALFVWFLLNQDERIEDLLHLLPLYQLATIPRNTLNNVINNRLSLASDKYQTRVSEFCDTAYRDSQQNVVISSGIEFWNVYKKENTVIVQNLNSIDFVWKNVKEIGIHKFTFEKVFYNRNRLKLFLLDSREGYVLDTKSCELSECPELPEERSGASFCFINHSSPEPFVDALLMVGGVNSKDSVNIFSKAIYKLDFGVSNSWNKKTSLPFVYTDNSLIVEKNIIFIVCGKKVEDSSPTYLQNDGQDTMWDFLDVLASKLGDMYKYNFTTDELEYITCLDLETSQTKLCLNDNKLYIFPVVLTRSVFQLKVFDIRTSSILTHEISTYAPRITRILDVYVNSKQEIILLSMYMRNISHFECLLSTLSCNNLGSWVNIPLGFFPWHCNKYRDNDFMFIRTAE